MDTIDLIEGQRKKKLSQIEDGSSEAGNSEIPLEGEETKSSWINLSNTPSFKVPESNEVSSSDVD